MPTVENDGLSVIMHLKALPAQLPHSIHVKPFEGLVSRTTALRTFQPADIVSRGWFYAYLNPTPSTIPPREIFKKYPIKLYIMNTDNEAPLILAHSSVFEMYPLRPDTDVGLMPAFFDTDLIRIDRDR